MFDLTLLYVHGTGVRVKSQTATLKEIRSKVNEFNLPCHFAHCLWGDVLGIEFDGLSLPNPLARTPEQEAQACRWEYLQVDPLFDLKLWCTPAAEPQKILGDSSAIFLWENLIAKYTPTAELKTLLDREGVKDFFEPAWNTVVLTSLPEKAFAGAGNEEASVAHVFAEAVVAQMMHDASEAIPPVAIPLNVRTKIVDRLLYDWEQMGKGVKDLLQKFFGRRTKNMIRPMRSKASEILAPAIGDILRYQALGYEIRKLIREKIDAIPGDVYVLSHSLGGIACFELMVESTPPNVKGLITAGSQAPLLYEFDALQTLRRGEKLPTKFPRWLNLYDENDLLSYCADLVFECMVDHRVDSILPPLEAHSAYWKVDDTWLAICNFMTGS